MEWESNVRGEDQVSPTCYWYVILILGENVCVVVSRGHCARVALLFGCEIQKLPNFSKKINSNLFPNHKLIYISPSLILYLVIPFFFFFEKCI